MSAPLSADLAQIGKSVVIKGDLSGSEDLYVDGQVEGSISLKNNSLTVGPHGQIKDIRWKPRAWSCKASLRATCRPAIASNCVSLPWLRETFPRRGFRLRKVHT